MLGVIETEQLIGPHAGKSLDQAAKFDVIAVPLTLQAMALRLCGVIVGEEQGSWITTLNAGNDALPYTPIGFIFSDPLMMTEYVPTCPETGDPI